MNLCFWEKQDSLHLFRPFPFFPLGYISTVKEELGVQTKTKMGGGGNGWLTLTLLFPNLSFFSLSVLEDCLLSGQKQLKQTKIVF